MALLPSPLQGPRWAARQLLAWGPSLTPPPCLPRQPPWRHNPPLGLQQLQQQQQQQQQVSCLAAHSSHGMPTSRRSSSRVPSVSPSVRLGRVQEAVLKLRHTMRTLSRGLQGKEVEMSGIGRHLGIKVTWSIRWRADGAFQEVISGKQLGFRWGFDGQPDSCCWEVDSSGVARMMELDDHELVLLGAWIRTGLWLQPHLISRLDIRVIDPGDCAFSSNGSSNTRSGSANSNGNSNSSDRSKSRSVSQAAAQAESSSSSNSDHISSNHGNGSPSAEGQGTASDSNSDAQASPRLLILGVRLKGGKLESRVHVCPHTWTILGVDQPLCGDKEVWQFGSWRSWQPGVFHPEHVSHEPVAGSQNVYVTKSCVVAPPSPLAHFQCPVTPLLPADTTFTPGVPPDLPVWRAGSSHLLVKPTINGKDGGYMILDTGASGFVITPEAAVSLGLEPFGEMYAASMTGKVAAQFVQAKSWCLGPLQVSSPVMMTMSVDGLVTGGPPGGDVIGIVGYDIFRRAVVELPAMRPHSNATPIEWQPQAASLASSPLPDPMPAHATLPTAAGMRTSHGVPHITKLAKPAAHVHAVRPASDGDLQGPQSQLAAGCPQSAWMMQGGTWGPGAGQLPGALPASPRSISSGDSMDVMAGAEPATAGQSGPLPFLQGLIHAASTGLGVGPWGASRNHVHSGTTTVEESAAPQPSGSPAAPPTQAAQPPQPPVSSIMTGQVTPSVAAASPVQVITPPSNNGSQPAVAVSSNASSTFKGSSSSSNNGYGKGKASSNGSSGPGSGEGLQPASQASTGGANGSTPVMSPSSEKRAKKSEKKREEERRQCQQFTMRLYHPGEYGPPQEDGWSWHNFKLVASLPHVEVRFPGSQGQPITTLLMVDSGAGGADIVLHTRAMRELDLASKPTESFLRGVGGVVKDDHKDRDKFLQTVDMGWVELLGVRFTQVSCMHVGSSGLDISLYASGILCGNMLSRLPTVYDYARKRLGVRLPPSAPAAALEDSQQA